MRDATERTRSPQEEPAQGQGAAGLANSDKQHTLREAVVINGVGVHSGKASRLTIHPAEAGAGVSFCRADSDATAPAIWKRSARPNFARRCVSATGRWRQSNTSWRRWPDSASTTPSSKSRARKRCVLDGSAAAIVAAIDEAGLRPQAAASASRNPQDRARRAGPAFAELSPADSGFTLDVEIDFAHAAIGRQRRRLALDPLPSAARSRAPARSASSPISKALAGGFRARRLARRTRSRSTLPGY